MRSFVFLEKAGKNVTSDGSIGLLFLNEFRECLRCNAVIIGISAVFFISLTRLR